MNTNTLEQITRNTNNKSNIIINESGYNQTNSSIQDLMEENADLIRRLKASEDKHLDNKVYVRFGKNMESNFKKPIYNLKANGEYYAFIGDEAISSLGQTSKDQVLGKHYGEFHDAVETAEVMSIIKEVRSFPIEEKNHLVVDIRRNKRFVRFDVVRDNGGVYIEESDLTDIKNDNLTGLPMRGTFKEYAKKAIHESDRYGQNIGFLFTDLDKFKYINDTYGHNAGDKLLKGVSSVLESNVRGVDMVARLGGDEFSILLKDINYDGLSTISKKLIEAINKPIDIGPISVNIGISLGSVLYTPNSNLTEGELMGRADKAMYVSKSNGRNLSTIYGDITSHSPYLMLSH